jgi:hypothetical protein
MSPTAVLCEIFERPWPVARQSAEASYMGPPWLGSLFPGHEPTHPLKWQTHHGHHFATASFPMPSSTIRSISITVSDDDGAAAAPTRRPRAVRRKAAARSLGQRSVRLVARWWPVLLLLPAVALLLFEASRLRASSPGPAPPVSSLGRLDPTTHLVHGVREREFPTPTLVRSTHKLFLLPPCP